MQRRTFLKGLGGIASAVCLDRAPGEVPSFTTEPTAGKAPAHVLEGAFGRAEIDLRNPALTRLYLRQADGRLAARSLLSECASEFPEWAVGGTSYLVGEDGQRYEARLSTGHHWESDADNRSLRILNVRPRTAGGASAPCLEDWELGVTRDGGLRWEIHRKFEEAFTATIHGGPALFFNISPNAGRTRSTRFRLNPGRNGVALSWWVAKEGLVGEAPDLYRKPRAPEVFLPKNKSVTMRDTSGWAIFQLYTSFAHDRDLRVHAQGGHLYRRGMYWSFAEIGLSVAPSVAYSFRKGQEIHVALEVYPEPQSESGQQLMVSVPDKAMERSLKRFFGGLANAGALADCENHLLGNETDGYLYAGSMWMHAYSLLASAPADRSPSSRPVTYADAVRKTLQYNLDSVDETGQVTAGFTHGAEFPELPMMNLIGLEAYLLYSGDLNLARRYQPEIRRMDRYLQTWLKDGLFYAQGERLKQPTGSINWYYDELIGAHGYTMYHNVNYVRTLKALETIWSALEQLDTALEYQRRRKQLIETINRHFWDDSAYGRGKGGYIDWIREDSSKGAYFFACNQYPAILHGVASPQQARALLATADSRISELRRYYHYTEEGTLDNLWPLRRGDIQLRHLRFGELMNGGMLLPMTFWEVTARCRAGGADQAYQLLKNFSSHAARTNWFEGVNAFSIDGRPTGWEGDPFLADQLVVAASVVHGFLGLDYSWNNFDVTPHLPSGWDTMSARILFKGIAYTIQAASDAQVRISKAT